MPLHRIPILGANTKPDNSGNVFPEPYSVKATNKLWRHYSFIFNQSSTRDGLAGMFTVPKGYVGSADLVLAWTATVTSGNVLWNLDYRAVGGDDTESYDQATAQEQVTGIDAAPTAINNRLERVIALTDGNFAPDDDVEFEIFRDQSGSLDTMAAAAILKRAFFQYSDS